MIRIRRSAALPGALMLLLAATGCADIRNELDAERRADAGPGVPALARPLPVGAGGLEGARRPGVSRSVSPSPPLSPSAPLSPPTVPATPSPTQGPCLASGVAYQVGPVDAVMSERAVQVELRNCGKRPYRVNGYPEIQVLDENREPLALTPSRAGSAGWIEDPGPRPLTLAPGDSVRTVLHWINRVLDTEPVGTGHYVVVASAPGKERCVLPALIDVGTVRELEATAWAVPADPGAP